MIQAFMDEAPSPKQSLRGILEGSSRLWTAPEGSRRLPGACSKHDFLNVHFYEESLILQGLCTHGRMDGQRTDS